MSREIRTSRWNELRAAAILNLFLSQENGLTVRHAGEFEEVDIHVFRGDQLIGMGEVKTDVDSQTAASRAAIAKHGAATFSLPKNSGQWVMSFRHSANVKKLQQGVAEIVALANRHGFTFVSPERLWGEHYGELRTSLEKYGIAYLWLQESSLEDRVILLQEPVSGLVPDECPNLQSLIDNVLSKHDAKRSLEILKSDLSLEQRHIIICLDSNSPVDVTLYAIHHALGLPLESVSLPAWVTDLWIVLPRLFQEGDVAWKFSPSKGWTLFAPGKFIEI